jgi:PLP dependent protein
MAMNAQAVQIQQRMEQIQERIRRAAEAAGRKAQHVRLVVVTKAQPAEVVRAALEAGAIYLGENYPEETVAKMQVLGRVEANWHMIGHLQSRKAALVTDNFDLLQSLDSARLAEKLERRLAESSRTLPVLLEMNVGGEESKFGWQAQDEKQWELLLPDIERIMAQPHLEIRGLMTMPPYDENPENTRPYFARLRKMSEWLGRRYSAEQFHELSMGTSVDFEAAVQEGATYVRIGEAILGPRPMRG